MCAVTPASETSSGSLTPDLVGELYAAESARVRRAVRRGVRARPGLIEDACQSAWARYVGAQDRVNRDAAISWLITTAIREAWRLARHEGRDLSLETLLNDTDDSEWEPLAPDMEEIAGLRLRLEALRSLPERQGRLVWLQGIGLSYADMALQTGDSPRTVQRQLLRGRHRLTEVDPGDGL